MLEIVHRGVGFWVINKPAGLSFHMDEGESGVIRLLKETYPEQDFFPVHRLDKMTSGLLIVALHREAAAAFGELFEKHLVEKRYVALSAKKPKKKQGTIKGGMEPSRRGQWRLTQRQDNLAVTQFFSAAFEGKRVFYLRPLTGKTHQIRVALKSVGSPILGDARYAGEVSDRGYLHAYSLSFAWQGEQQVFCLPPSEGEYFNESFAEFLKQNFNEASIKWPSGQ